MQVPLFWSYSQRLIAVENDQLFTATKNSGVINGGGPVASTPVRGNEVSLSLCTTDT
jgi:hypothetical protein